MLLTVCFQKTYAEQNIIYCILAVLKAIKQQFWELRELISVLDTNSAQKITCDSISLYNMSGILDKCPLAPGKSNLFLKYDL